MGAFLNLRYYRRYAGSRAACLVRVCICFWGEEEAVAKLQRDAAVTGDLIEGRQSQWHKLSGVCSAIEAVIAPKTQAVTLKLAGLARRSSVQVGKSILSDHL